MWLSDKTQDWDEYQITPTTDSRFREVDSTIKELLQGA